MIDSPTRVLFLSQRPTGSWHQLQLGPTGEPLPGDPSTWRLQISGECRPQIVLPEGVSRAELHINPATSPSPGGRSLPLLIVEWACASGRSPEGRILPPEIAFGNEGVFVSLTIRNRPGDQDCQGNPEYPFTLQLSEPLGSRQLFDASLVPPAPVKPPTTP